MALGLGARYCELELAWGPVGVMATSIAVKVLQFTAFAVIGRMETKPREAGVPPKQSVAGTSNLLWHVEVLGWGRGSSS